MIVPYLYRGVKYNYRRLTNCSGMKEGKEIPFVPELASISKHHILFLFFLP